MKKFILICVTLACALTLATKPETTFAKGDVKIFHTSDESTALSSAGILRDALEYSTFLGEMTPSGTAAGAIRFDSLFGYSISSFSLTNTGSDMKPCIVAIVVENKKDEDVRYYSFPVYSKETLFLLLKSKPSVIIPHAYDRLISACTQ